MKILFITTQNPTKQGDLLEISLLHGLRNLLGNDCVDYPRKKIMYHDFSDTPKDSLHGRGFSLLTTPIKDIENRDIFNQKFDYIEEIDQIIEKWSEKYKMSIDCDNPKGFSQRAHCKGKSGKRKK